MSPRAPSRPPRLEGYEYLSVLGGGGFADVFLYRQERPQREVAIKVLLSGADDPGVRHVFESEANVMAAMSTHPSIVTIHQAEVSADGRPCIVMEYCSRPNYGVRFRSERIAVDEALRVGVMIAGAVETAHRAGILHRDIKPANILVTEYNRPALTDFGISIATADGTDVEDSTGMSIPWSPPECFADPPRFDVRSDVFSLAATVYSLLAGRTPFERTGGRNTAAELIHRIASEPLPALDRPDIPASLHRVLAVAMAKDPAARYDSALALGRALQQIEGELALPVTSMDVLEDRSRTPVATSAEPDELDAHTRLRSITTVSPDSGGDAPRRELDPFAGIAPAPAELSVPRRAAASPGEDTSTVIRSAASPAPSAPVASGSVAADPGQGRSGLPAWALFSLIGVLVVALGLGAVLAVRTAFPAVESEPTPTMTTAPVAIGGGEAVDPPATVSIEPIPIPGRSVSKARIVWDRPEGFTAEDRYVVRWVDLPGGYEQYGEPQHVAGRESMVMDAPPNQQSICVEVSVLTPSGEVGDATRACSP